MATREEAKQDRDCDRCGAPIGAGEPVWSAGGTADTAARLNAIVAVEHDLVRRAELIAGYRLAAAVVLSERVEVAEALLAGVPVPAKRLHPALAAELELAGKVELDYELALRVIARGPLEQAERRRRAA